MMTFQMYKHLDCTKLKIKISNKTWNFISLYISSSHEFESFADTSKLCLDSITITNPYLIVVLDDFDAQAIRWYLQGKTTY